jgi:hypothetical protein
VAEPGLERLQSLKGLQVKFDNKVHEELSNKIFFALDIHSMTGVNIGRTLNLD